MVDGCEINSSERSDSVGISRRNWGALLTAGAIAAIGGFLLPISAHIPDILLVFSISLTAAVLIITFSARSALQAPGFPLLIVLSSMLRIALGIGLAKMILLHGDAGTVISLLGNIIFVNNHIPATLFFAILVVTIFVIISKTVKGISRVASGFTTDIATYTNNEIDDNQDPDVQNRISREVVFFTAMNSVARFVLCVAVIELVIIIVNIVSSIAMGIAKPASSGILVKTYINLAIGAGVVTQISALVTAIASGYLVRKSFATAIVPTAYAASTKQASKRIGVVSSEIIPSQNAEPQHNNTVSCDEAVEDFDYEITEAPDKFINSPYTEKKLFQESQWYDMDSGNEKDELSLWLGDEIKDNDCYTAIAELIESKSSDGGKTILMAAETVDKIGVIVPVNTAINLARKGRSCLLVDLDLEKQAISTVFDINSTDLPPEKIVAGIPTSINNISVLQGDNLYKENITNIFEIIADIENRYDHLIIYAPNILRLRNIDKLASNIRSAMLFGIRSEFKNLPILELGKRLISYGCDILEPGNILASVF